MTSTKDSRVGSKCKFEVTWLPTAESQIQTILVCPKTASHPHPSPSPDRCGKFLLLLGLLRVLSPEHPREPQALLKHLLYRLSHLRGWSSPLSGDWPGFTYLSATTSSSTVNLHLHPLDLDCNSGTVPPPIPFSFHLSMLADFLP